MFSYGNIGPNENITIGIDLYTLGAAIKHSQYQIQNFSILGYMAYK